MNLKERHEMVCRALTDICIKKNTDYGNSFGDTYRELGIISAVTRISDKVNRLKSLCMRPESERRVADESIRDTLLDTANYCILTILEMDNETNTQEAKTCLSGGTLNTTGNPAATLA